MSSNSNIGELTLESVLQRSLDGLFAISRERKVVYFSKGCERLTGESSASVIGASCTCHQLINCRDEHGRSLTGALCPAIKIFDGEISNATQRMSILKADGEQVWIETNYTPVLDELGNVNHVVGIMRDVTLTKEKEDELRQRVGQARSLEPETPGGFSQYKPSRQDTSIGVPLDSAIMALGRKEILSALGRARGQRTLAEQLLGISRSRLYRRLEALGIGRRDSA